MTQLTVNKCFILSQLEDPGGYPPYSPGRPGVRSVPPTVPPTTTTPPPLQDPYQQIFPPMSMFDPYFPAAQQPQHPRYLKSPPYMYRPLQEQLKQPLLQQQAWIPLHGPIYPQDPVFAGSSPVNIT